MFYFYRSFLSQENQLSEVNNMFAKLDERRRVSEQKTFLVFQVP